MTRTFVIFALTALSVVCALVVGAEPKKAVLRAPKRPTVAQTATTGPVQSAHRRSPYVGAIAVNAETGAVLFEQDADAEAYPASVTKLMTLLLVLEDVRAGKYALADKVVTTTAVNGTCEASWIGLKCGDAVSVGDLCRALMVESANDAAIMLAAHASGTWKAFVERMNARAQELGMRQTRYFNPNGLPPSHVVRGRAVPYPWSPNFNRSTARDQSRLALHLAKMPEVFSFTSIKTCDLVKTADGYRVSVTRKTGEPQRSTALAAGEQTVKQMRNHNNVMVKDKKKVLNPDGTEAVDGLKTGYIGAGGSSVILTGKRKGKRAIVVVLGSASADERDANAARLLSDALGALSW